MVDKRGVYNNSMVNYDVYVVYFIGDVAFASNEGKKRGKRYETSVLSTL